MSDIIKYDKSIQANCTVEAITAVNQKGGYVKVQIKIPITAGDPAGAKELSGELVNHLGNIARVTLEFSSMKKGQSSASTGDEDPSQLGLDNLEEKD